MSAESIQPYDWFGTVAALCCPVIEQLQAELDAASWCYPGGAQWIREWLREALGAATEGRPADVFRHLRKLDLEWWWWSRGGCDWPPDRPAGECRPADQWLALDADCTAWAIAVETAKKATGGSRIEGPLDGSSRSDFTRGPDFPGGFGVSE
jgi:hypothetical protein